MFNKKKKHFKRKLFDVERAMWDLEFKMGQAGELREKIRLDRDAQVIRVTALEGKKESEEELAKVKELVERYEKQMKMIDDQVNGGTPAEDDPTGEGIVGKIARLHELKVMLTNYIKTL